MPLKKAICSKCYESKEVTWVWENDRLWLMGNCTCPFAPEGTPKMRKVEVVKKDRFKKFHHSVTVDIVLTPVSAVPPWCLRATDHA
jgi:hypothetical protein